MISDGNQNYDHNKDGGDYKLAGCAIDFRGKEHSVFARIVYQEGLLRMYVDSNDNEWQECFVIRSVKLPRGYYFGTTAATGDLADNHDILAIKVSSKPPTPKHPPNRVLFPIVTSISPCRPCWWMLTCTAGCGALPDQPRGEGQPAAPH